MHKILRDGLEGSTCPESVGGLAPPLPPLLPTHSKRGRVAAMSTTLQLCTNDDDAVSIGISPSDAVGAAAGGGNSMEVQRWLCASGLATLIMDAATAFYRSPHGVVFEQHMFAYYATLAGIFAAGLAEVGTACWLAS